MSKFTKPAPWLRRFFIPSGVDFREPGQVSNDVSLVQPYDGGSYPEMAGVEKVFTVTSAAGANTYTDLFTLTNEQIARLVSVSMANVAGGASGAMLVTDDGSTPEAPCSVYAGAFANSQQTLDGSIRAIPILAPIIGPGMRVRLRVTGGDASTQVIANWLVYIVPVGSVFYL